MAYRDLYLLRRSEEFHLEPGQEASINLKLHKAPPLPCTRLRGQVVSNTAKIGGATVKILTPELRPICHTETDKDGKFAFDQVLVPGKYELLVYAKGYLVSESRLISLKPLSTLYIRVKLIRDKNAANAAVYGTVRNGENIPLQGAAVCISGQKNGHPISAAVTNADGEYLFTGLGFGKYALSAFYCGYTLPEEIQVELLPKDIYCADLYLYRDAFAEKGTVSGAVLHDGHPVPNAVTALYRKEQNGYSLIKIQQANSDGVYLFSELSAGEYTVSAKPEG